MSRVASRVGSRVASRVGSRLGGGAIDTRAQFDLNFAAGKFWADGSLRTLAEVMNYTRPNPCWVVDSDYVLHEFAANEVPAVNKQGDGYIPFGESTNILLNSDAPATQSVTITDATAYTLSVWSQDGTGSAEVTAGGSGTATGNWRDQNHLTFTSSGTSVTVTLSGNVDYIQLEEGENPTEFIKTAGSAVTRDDFTQSEGTALIAGLLNDSEGTLLVECQASSSDGAITQIDDGAITGNRHLLYWTGSTNPSEFRARVVVEEGSVNQARLTYQDSSLVGMAVPFTYSYAADDFTLKVNGSTVGTDAAGAVPSGLSRVTFGIIAGTTARLNGRITRVIGYNTKGAV